MDVRQIRIEHYDYLLPDSRIALHPLAERDSCKLLVESPDGKISHHIFSDLPILVKPETLIVANETKVIRARMEFLKASGAKIEIFLLEPFHPHDYVTNFAATAECSWVCLVGNKKRWKEGLLTKELIMGAEGKKVELTAEIEKESDSGIVVKFRWNCGGFSFAEIVEKAGNIPIPPYLKRKSEESDTEDYQTVYSRTEGSVAAPTAGLHFTPRLIEELKRRGDDFTTVTLHVGAGTFQPVKSEEIGDHPMHTEHISVSRATIMRIISALESGRDILAVGTTSVRTLESLPYFGILARDGVEEMRVTQWMAYDKKYADADTIGTLRSLLDYLKANSLDTLEAETSIMIAPGFRWRIVNRLITNFHQPKSTLLLLVSSFLGNDSGGVELWRKIYDEALKKDYRFLSYGDACLFSRGPQSILLPLSKSMVIRAATIKAVKGEWSALDKLTENGVCEDSLYYIDALKKVRESAVTGREIDINIGEGAAPLRFLIAFAASYENAKITVKCRATLQKRPVSPLISTLKELGADIEFNDTPGFWSVKIKGKKLEGGTIETDISTTSQFVSALLLAAPLWKKGIEIRNAGSLRLSRPYVRMTEEMLQNPDLPIEADWSAAAFFYEWTLISGRKSVIARLTPPGESVQGDSMVADVYSSLGVNTEFRDDGSAVLSFDRERFDVVKGAGEFEYGFGDYPDVVPSVAVALCYCRIPFRLHGIGHLRHKESNRLEGLRKNLLRLGYEVEVVDDSLVFNGEFKPFEEFPVSIDSMADHRMAMAFYPLELAGMAVVGDKAVVAKSFPDFYSQFK